MWNPEKIWHQNLINCPRHLLSAVATLPWEILTSHFQHFQLVCLVAQFIQRHSAVRRCATSIYKKTGGVACKLLIPIERLELLGLERLESRRIRADILFAYKLLFGLIALQSDYFFILSESTCTKRHPYKLFLPRCSTDVRKYVFCHCIVKIWN